MKKQISRKIILTSTLLLSMTACNKVAFKPITNATDSSFSMVAPEPNNPRTISKSEVVAYGNKQVDFLLVLDDSNSMLPELKKLSAKMSTFVTSLDASNIDWQMCLTTTRGYVSGNQIVHGPNIVWKNYSPNIGVPAYLLKRGTANLNQIFTSTIDNLTIGGANSGDERGIKATYDHFKNSINHNCYRKGAAVSVILISDEDERSVGGDSRYLKIHDNPSALQPMEFVDLPESLTIQAKATFGEDLRFTFSSIIVKPNDFTCEAEQDTDTSPSHFGRNYEALSKLTDGGIGSICDADYSANLNTFKDKIVNSLSSLVLDCNTNAAGMRVKIQGQNIKDFKVEGKILKFATPLVEGTKIDLSYECIN